MEWRKIKGEEIYSKLDAYPQSIVLWNWGEKYEIRFDLKGWVTVYLRTNKENKIKHLYYAMENPQDQDFVDIGIQKRGAKAIRNFIYCLSLLIREENEDS